MKKLMSLLMGVLILFGISLNTGCDKKPDDIRAIMNAAGVGVAYGWISFDNPTDEQKAQVTEVLSAVQNTIEGVGTNTYVEVIYPKVQEYVAASTKIKEKDKPLVLAGSLAMLSGIDVTFRTHPEWKADVDNVGSYVKSFISGANSILALPCTDGSCEEAVKHYKIRSTLKLK
ncbi:MAG: hypothetical protein ABFD50_16400 [Smithella sp.]